MEVYTREGDPGTSLPMTSLERQVAAARSRIALNEFLRGLPWALTVAGVVAWIPLALPKFWRVAVDPEVWRIGWLGGALMLGLIYSLARVGWRYPSKLAAAGEIDRRCRLKERVSSSIALHGDQRSSPIGTALIQDADRRVASVEIREVFPPKPTWWHLLPLAPLAIAGGIAWVAGDTDGRVPTTPTSTNPIPATHSAEVLKKRLETERKELEAKGLKDAAHLLAHVEKEAEAIRELSKTDRKASLIKLNDLTKSVKARQNEIGDLSKLKRQLEQIKDLPKGPADKLAKALREGDFKQGLKALQETQKQLTEGKLDAKQKEAMGKQLQAMSQELKSLAEKHEAAQQQMAREIEKARQAGDFAKAGAIQDQLDALKRLSAAVKSSETLSQQLAEAAKKMEAGDPQAAAENLAQMEQELQKLADSESELQSLEQSLQQLADFKDAMQCPHCQGDGCQECLGQGDLASLMNGGNGNGKNPGQGLGEGQGKGDRPESEGDTNLYDSQVRGTVRDGKAVRVGTADGPNIAGDSLEQIRQAVEAAEVAEDDPLTNVKLPRGHRDHVRQYFDAVRDGDSATESIPPESSDE